VGKITLNDNVAQAIGAGKRQCLKVIKYNVQTEALFPRRENKSVNISFNLKVILSTDE
jgi:hypothetical protein